MEILRKKMETRPEIFQGRTSAFAQETVDKIVREGFDKSQEPIVAWHDQKKDRYVVISGHSRWEASKILFKKGDKSLSKMPVKIFQGTMEEAADFAILESNRSGTQENIISDIRAFKRAKSKGHNREFMKGIFKPESRLRKLEDLSFLNEKGLFIEMLSSDARDSFPFLERNAQWVGIIRKQFNQLSNSHENEIFRWLYNLDRNSKGSKQKNKLKTITKQQFFDSINQKASRIDFDSKKPLNLNNTVSTSAVTSDLDLEIREVEKEMEKLKVEHNKKFDMILQAKAEGNEKLAKRFKERQSEINQILLRLTERKARLEKNKSTAKQTFQFDLFSQPENPKQMALIAKAKRALQKQMVMLESLGSLHGIPILTSAEEKDLLGREQSNTLSGPSTYDIITDMIIKEIEKDGLFWRKPWKPQFSIYASNFISKQAYRGINWVLLNMVVKKGNPYWMTFKQVKTKGGKIKKGAKGAKVVYYKLLFKNMQGKRITEEEAKKLKPEDVERIPMLKSYTVFNGGDIEGINFKLEELPGGDKNKPIESAEAIMANMNPKPDIRIGGDRAFYTPGGDYISMPPFNWFHKEAEYYSTLFHETVHWTGAPHRLNRIKGGTFGDAKYAFEELVAEMGAAYLCGEAGIFYFTLNNSAAYIQSWKRSVIKTLREDNKAIIKAASESQKAADYILGSSSVQIEEQPKPKRDGICIMELKAKAALALQMQELALY